MEDLRVGKWTIPAAELVERFETSGGPGGQHANRNKTGVRLSFNIAESSLPGEVRSTLMSRLGTKVEVHAAEQRSQSRNREMARRRLASKLEGALVETKDRRATKPTRSSKKRRVDNKKARGQVKKQRRPPTLDD